MWVCLCGSSASLRTLAQCNNNKQSTDNQPPSLHPHSLESIFLKHSFFCIPFHTHTTLNHINIYDDGTTHSPSHIHTHTAAASEATGIFLKAVKYTTTHETHTAAKKNFSPAAAPFLLLLAHTHTRIASFPPALRKLPLRGLPAQAHTKAP